MASNARFTSFRSAGRPGETWGGRAYNPSSPSYGGVCGFVCELAHPDINPRKLRANGEKP